MLKPVAAAVAAALMSGATMYTVGAKTATVDAFSQQAAVQPLTAQPLTGVQSFTNADASVATRAFRTTTPVTPVRTAPRRTVDRSNDVSRDGTARATSASSDVVADRDEKPARSWQKTALIIGGSTASGAGIGALIGGKKGALIGAAVGGGASTIYEVTKR
jgi:hypothetical protein